MLCLHCPRPMNATKTDMKATDHRNDRKQADGTRAWLCVNKDYCAHLKIQQIKNGSICQFTH